MNRIILLSLLAIWLMASTTSSADFLIDTCGWFEYFRDRCVLFATVTGCHAYATPFSTIPDSLQNFAIVRVRGELSYIQEWCGFGPNEEFLENPIISPCQPVDLGCGTLGCQCIEFEPPCYHWHSPHNGDLEIYSLHGYSVGDTVHVMGIIVDCLGSSLCSFSMLALEEFGPCEETPPGVESSTWGSLKVLFR
jgi:hypothetical protein